MVCSKLAEKQKIILIYKRKFYIMLYEITYVSTQYLDKRTNEIVRKEKIKVVQADSKEEAKKEFIKTGIKHIKTISIEEMTGNRLGIICPELLKIKFDDETSETI